MRARPGFTLLEVTVALTVAALALTAGMFALGTVADRSAHTEQASVAALEAAAARQQIVHWLEGARLRSINGVDTFQGLSVEYGGVPDDILLFPTTSATHLRASETIVRLYIDRDDETPEQGLVAELTTQRGLDSRRVELLPQVVGLSLRYLPPSAGSVAVEWDEQWLTRNLLPRAVEMTLLAAPGTALPPLLEYPIRVALGTQ
jgi:prepilin-type N-terminal cleavage/methylation domain-containing protein